jgi:hypothetical protein
MARTLSMEQLADYFAAQVDEIARLEAEVEEIQVGFNSAFVEFKTQHDETLIALTDQVLAQYDAISPALHTQMEARRVEEREALLARRAALSANLIPAARKEADDKMATAREAEAKLRKLNPVWDMKEERIKTRLRDWRAELESLNAEIKAAGKGLGFVTHYIRITKLDRRRSELIGKMGEAQNQLEETRAEWQEKVRDEAGEQKTLQDEWQELSMKAARLQDELDYLDDDARLEALAWRRAITGVLDEIKDPAIIERGALRDEIGEMIRLNIQTDNYQEGLGTVAGVIALLRGVSTGYRSFRASVEAIINEQKMHSAYLTKLSMPLPASVEQFNAQWEPLRKSLRDEKRLSRFPLEFVAVVEPALKDGLSAPSIQKVFAALESELKRATASWRGSK